MQNQVADKCLSAWVAVDGIRKKEKTSRALTGGQMLICVGGRGWYQEEGKIAVELLPGSVVNIPVGVKHWHGAAKDSWFSHLALEIPGEKGSTTWCEPVSEEDYGKLN